MTAEEKRLEIVRLITIHGESCKIPLKEVSDDEIPTTVAIETDSPYKYSIIGAGGPTLDVYLVFIDETETVDAYQYYNTKDQVTKNPATYDYALETYRKLVNDSVES